MKRVTRASSYLFFKLCANSTKYQIPRDISNKVISHSSTISRRKLLLVKEPIDDYGEETISPIYRVYKSDPTFYQLF